MVVKIGSINCRCGKAVFTEKVCRVLQLYYFILRHQSGDAEKEKGTRLLAKAWPNITNNTTKFTCGVPHGDSQFPLFRMVVKRATVHTIITPPSI